MTEAEIERARVVEWLRSRAYARWCVSDDDGEALLSATADAIERGEHLKDETQ